MYLDVLVVNEKEIDLGLEIVIKARQQLVK